jgi:hypothetical protein
MKRNHKIMAISVVGLLALAVISAATINSLPVAKAGCDDNCKDEAYGDLVSSEAQNDDPLNPDDTRKGFGDEVSPLAKDKESAHPGMKEFRESGVNARGGDSAPGKSGEAHGNDD